MNALAKFHTIPALPDQLNFNPVREQQTRNGAVVDGKWWTVNPNTDEVIGDGKRNHNPQNFNLMWDSLREGLHQSGLQLDDVTTTFTPFNNNAGMRAEIVLPNHSFVEALGEPACLKIRVVDSHDQTQRRQIGAMIMRLACLNGMLSMSDYTSLSQLHTVNADPEFIGRVASTWPEMLLFDADRMQAMRKVKLDRDTAQRFYAKNITRVKTKVGSKVNMAFLERVMGIHDSYKMECSAYKVYNVITHLATHVESKGCASRKQLAIESYLGRLVKGPAFKQLAQMAA